MSAIGSLVTWPDVEEGDLRDARAFAATRPIAYPLGSAQAENVALQAGFRPMIRQLLSPTELQVRKRAFERAGFATAVAPVAYTDTRAPKMSAHPLNSPVARGAAVAQALFIGRDPATVRAGVACELAQTDASQAELGRVLGYPRCCVESFVEASVRDTMEMARIALRQTEGRPHPRLNMLDMQVFHYISWFPCSYSCVYSIRYADAIAAVIARKHPSFVRQIDAALSADRLFVADDVQLSMRGKLHQGQLRPTEVWPTARDRHPSSVLEDDALELVARLCVLLRAASGLRIHGGQLFADDREIPTPRGAVLIPFGALK